MLNPKMKIGELIDDNSKLLDEGDLSRMFVPLMVAKIKMIRPFFWMENDKLIWNGTQSGNFIVKSAY